MLRGGLALTLKLGFRGTVINHFVLRQRVRTASHDRPRQQAAAEIKTRCLEAADRDFEDSLDDISQFRHTAQPL